MVEGLRDVREQLSGSGWRVRRRWTVALVAAGALVCGVVASAAAWVSDTERIGSFWTYTAVSDSGRAQVVEVIDYDFGFRQRHGILREVPGLDTTVPVGVSSPTAPDGLLVNPVGSMVTLRVGDPDSTVSGRHRYRIEYETDALVRGERFSWNAVGIGWTVPIDEIEIHVTAPFRFEDLQCDQGRRRARGGCTADEVEAGHLVVETSGLSAHEGVTVTATRGPSLADPVTAPLEPTGPADDPGYGWLQLGAAVAITTFVAGLAAYWVVRRLGRERVWSTEPVSAAFGPTGMGGRNVASVDPSELAELATTEFAAPAGLSAAQGGVVYDEDVREQHKTAWLLERAVDGEIVIERRGGPLIKRTEMQSSLEDEPILDEMFGNGPSLSLGRYDSRFAWGWRRLDAKLEDWQATCGLWVPHWKHRRRTARVIGIALLVVGVAVAAVGAGGANRWGSMWLSVALGGSLVAGAGLALLFGAWELRRRTPEGSARWLQVESFRRFLASSEARHVEAAAQMGLVREYTAWAMSLGEMDHWRHVVDDAIDLPHADLEGFTCDIDFVHDVTGVAPFRVTATATAPPPPPPRPRHRSSDDDRSFDFDSDTDSDSDSDFGCDGAGSGGGGGGGSSW